MAAVDTDLLPDALASALRHLLEVDGFPGDWAALVAMAGERAQWAPARCQQLIAGDSATLAELAAELNERREL